MPRFWTMRNPRSTAKVERLIAVAAVAVTAFAFAQPPVLTLAGLDFAGSAGIGQPVDPLATGSLAGTTNGAVSHVHGLAGTLKALRARD